MKKVRPWCGQPADRRRLKNRTEHGRNGFWLMAREAMSRTRVHVSSGPCCRDERRA